MLQHYLYCVYSSKKYKIEVIIHSSFLYFNLFHKYDFVSYIFNFLSYNTFFIISYDLFVIIVTFYLDSSPNKLLYCEVLKSKLCD